MPTSSKYCVASTMPSKSGCSPVDVCRPGKPPRSAWRTSVVDSLEPLVSRDVSDSQCHVKVIQGQDGVSQSHVFCGRRGAAIAEGEAKLSSVVDKSAGDHPTNALTSGHRHDGRTVAGLIGATHDAVRPNGQCSVDHPPRSTPNGHCATGNTVMSRGTSDHMTAGDTGTGGTGVEAETPGCFACIALCQGKDSRKSSK